LKTLTIEQLQELEDEDKMYNTIDNKSDSQKECVNTITNGFWTNGKLDNIWIKPYINTEDSQLLSTKFNSFYNKNDLLRINDETFYKANAKFYKLLCNDKIEKKYNDSLICKFPNSKELKFNVAYSVLINNEEAKKYDFPVRIVSNISKKDITVNSLVNKSQKDFEKLPNSEKIIFLEQTKELFKMHNEYLTKHNGKVQNKIERHLTEKIDDKSKIFVKNDEEFQIKNGLVPALISSGISAGYTGKGYSNIIPNSVIVKINLRFGPTQNAKKITKIVNDYLLSKIPKNIFHNGENTKVKKPTYSLTPKCYLPKLFDFRHQDIGLHHHCLF
jgi:hypothetical protein